MLVLHWSPVKLGGTGLSFMMYGGCTPRHFLQGGHPPNLPPPKKSLGIGKQEESRKICFCPWCNLINIVRKKYFTTFRAQQNVTTCIMIC